MFDILWRGIVIGIGATVLMDIWAIVLNRFFGQAPAQSLFRAGTGQLGAGRALVLSSEERQGFPRQHRQCRTLRA